MPAQIPTGSVLVTYPFPGPLNAETMAWQAHNDFRYRMVGGYQNLPDGRGGFTHEGNPSVTRDVLNGLFGGIPAPPLTAELRRTVLRDLGEWDAATVVVDMGVTGSAAAVELFTDLLGRSPTYDEGVAVWYDLPFARGRGGEDVGSA